MGAWEDHLSPRETYPVLGKAQASGFPHKTSASNSGAVHAQ